MTHAHCAARHRRRFGRDAGTRRPIRGQLGVWYLPAISAALFTDRPICSIETSSSVSTELKPPLALMTMPKVVICVVPGWAAGGGHSLHATCDLTLASRQHARFKQTDTDVASFDGGFGSAYLARQTGQKFAREIFFLGRNYSAQEAFDMGMVNAVVPHAELEDTAYQWALEILAKSPTSIKMLKFAFNLTDDGMVGQQVFAGEATRLAYMTEEAKEGRNAFLEKRKPDFSNIKWIP